VNQSIEIRWISFPSRANIPPDETVWISVARFEASWKKNQQQYVGPGGSGAAIEGRYEKFGAWIESGEAVWIPLVGLERGEISFTDGRHRFAWLRDHGMQSIPIDVDPDIAKEIQKRFGSFERTSFCQYENG
jgi:hypothetical protein